MSKNALIRSGSSSSASSPVEVEYVKSVCGAVSGAWLISLFTPESGRVIRKVSVAGDQVRVVCWVSEMP